MTTEMAKLKGEGIEKPRKQALAAWKHSPLNKKSKNYVAQEGEA